MFSLINVNFVMARQIRLSDFYSVKIENDNGHDYGAANELEHNEWTVNFCWFCEPSAHKENLKLHQYL